MISDMKYIKYLAYVLLVSTFTLIVVYVTLALSDSDVCSFIRENLINNIGDFSWGTIGIFLTFTSTLFMYFTFSSQQKQFKETKDDAYRTRFEGTFFNMISMLYNVRAEADKQIAYSTKDDQSNLKSFYITFKNKYEEKIKSDSDFAQAMNVLEKEDVLVTEYNTAVYDLGDFYDQYVLEQKCNAGFYFRYIHNLVKFVLRQWKGNANDIHMYLNFIQAQMSDEELALVFYDTISNKGLDKNRQYTFKNNLDEYSFLENVSASTLLSRCHYKIFPKTIFGFLNEDERKRIKSGQTDKSVL